MAVTQLNTSTLSENLDGLQNEFAVASTANISVGNYLVIQGTGGLEAVKVQAIPVSGRVQVARAVGGTRARSHKSGARFFIGNPADFAAQSAAARGAIDGLVGSNGFFPEYTVPGLRAKDGMGNEYVLVDLTMTAFAGTTVLISRDGLYTASVLTSANAGSVGVVVEEGTSNQYVWAQIYGSISGVQLVGGSSLCTSTGIFQAATSVSTPSVGLLGRTTSQASSEATVRVFGMYPTSAATTATTSASSATGLSISAWLNYPFVERAASS